MARTKLWCEDMWPIDLVRNDSQKISAIQNTMTRIMINIIMRHRGTISVYGPADFDLTFYSLLFISIKLNFFVVLETDRP